MKKILLITITIFLMGSCSKDMLELSPLDRISESSVWNDGNLIQAYVNSQYRCMLDPFGQSNSNMYYSGEAYSNNNHVISWSFRDGSLTPDNVNLLSNSLNYWNTGYSYLRNINTFFDKIEKAPVVASNKALMIGEMKFLRAFIYSTLLKNYGGVPIVDKLFQLNDELSGVKRNSYQEVLSYIIKDLDEVITALPAKQTGVNAGRASADAARALKARVLLYDASPLNNPSNSKAKWQAASDASATLLASGYSLHSNYRNLFLTDATSEVIFQKYYNPENGSDFLWKASSPGNNGYGQFSPTQNFVDAFEMKNGQLPFLSNGSINPASGYDPENPYINRDSRFYDMVLYNGAIYKGAAIEVFDINAAAGLPLGRDFKGNDATKTGYHMRKFMNETAAVSQLFNYTSPWIYFRLAEVYLNYAEAQFELGNEPIAREYVNKVRKRANMPDITEAGDALRVRIQHERQIELAFEGHRFYDLRRWKIAPVAEMTPIIGTKVTQPSKGVFAYTRYQILPGKWADKYYYIPIALEEISKSKNSLVQNPGW